MILNYKSEDLSVCLNKEVIDRKVDSLFKDKNRFKIEDFNESQTYFMY